MEKFENNLTVQQMDDALNSNWAISIRVSGQVYKRDNWFVIEWREYIYFYNNEWKFISKESL